MRRDTRLSRMLHLLIHMDKMEGCVTSETISKMLRTNSVVVRRMMAGLRERGYVRSEKGPGGGWRLNVDLGDMSLLDVYRAVGSPTIFAIGPDGGETECLVEHAVDDAIMEALGEAEARLLSRFEGLSVADLAQDFKVRLAERT